MIRAVTEGPQGAKVFEAVAREMGEAREIKVQTLRGQKGFSDAGAVFSLGLGTWGRLGVGSGLILLGFR